MGRIGDRFVSFFTDRWLVFVAAMWIQSCAGIGYLFGSISPVIKGSLSYNQRQVARLGVAKDLGDSVGFLAGSLCEILPLWAALFIGALQNFVGYGWVWLVVTGRSPVLPLWAVSFFFCRALYFDGRLFFLLSPYPDLFILLVLICNFTLHIPKVGQCCAKYS